MVTRQIPIARSSTGHWPDSDLRGKQNWLILVRFFAALVCLGSVQLLDAPADQETSGLTAVTYFLLILFSTNLLYFLLATIWASHAFIRVQLCADCLFASGLIYLTGGVNSPFNVLYFVVILGGAMAVSRAFSAVMASLCTILLCAVTIAYLAATIQPEKYQLPWVNPIHEQAFQVRNVQYILYYMCVQAASFYLVAFLSGALSDRIARQKIVQDEILQNMGEGVIVIDAERRVLFANQKTGDLLGLDAATMTGKLLRSAHELLGEGVDRQISDAPDGMTELAVYATEDGSDGRLVELHVSVLRDGRGRLRGAIVLLRDISDLRELETMRAREERLKSVSQLASGIAHEIRNPLASIRGAAQELGSGSTTAGDAHRLMSIVIRESDRLNGIITDFLQFASMRKLRPVCTSLRTLVDETAILLRQRPDAASADIRVDYRSVAPDDALALTADDEQLRQVFLNLGINALEAGAKQNIILRIVVSRQQRYHAHGPAQPDSRVYARTPGYRVDFVDNGPGIDPDDAAKLFTPFFTTKPKGTGMGLAIAHKIVIEHGGSVSVDSAPGKGATFSIWFPETGRTAAD